MTPFADEWVKIARSKQEPPYKDRKPITKAHLKEFLISSALVGGGAATGAAIGTGIRHAVRKGLLRRYLRMSPRQRRAYREGMPNRHAVVGGVLGAGAGGLAALLRAKKRQRMQAVDRLPRERP